MSKKCKITNEILAKAEARTPCPITNFDAFGRLALTVICGLAFIATIAVCCQIEKYFSVLNKERAENYKSREYLVQTHDKILDQLAGERGFSYRLEERIDKLEAQSGKKKTN